jgi:nucleoside-diphosphate-sugar epimerase
VRSRPFDVPVNVLDISLAATHLDWRPTYRLHDGLRRTLEWLQSAQGTESTVPGVPSAAFPH